VRKQQDQPTDSLLHCPECDYNLTGATGGVCPWCGSRIDVDMLTSAAQGTTSRRVAATVVCLVLGAGSLVSLFSLAWKGLSSFSLRDGLAVISVAAAGMGHLTLAVLTATGRSQWPLRRDEARTILRYVGWLSIVLAVIGATRLVRIRVVQGFAATNVFEFGLAAILFSLPGWTLLIMCMLAFRPDRHRGNRRGRGGPDVETPRAPFSIDVLGSFCPEQIVQSWSLEPRPTTPAIEAAIARHWEAESAVALERGRRLFDGALVRVQSVKVINGRLSFVFGPTSYREFFGTNLYGASTAMATGEACLANPLGVSATVITRDGFLAYGRRSDRVAFHAGFVHGFGGMLDEQDRGLNKKFDLFGCIVREVCEELGLSSSHISDVRHVGLVRDNTLQQPEMLFDVTVAVDKAYLASRFEPSLSDGEHTKIEFVPDDPEGVATFLDRVDRMAPVAQAALLLHGRRVWRRDWYDRVCFVRFGRVPEVAFAHEPERHGGTRL